MIRQLQPRITREWKAVEATQYMRKLSKRGLGFKYTEESSAELRELRTQTQQNTQIISQLTTIANNPVRAAQGLIP